MRAYQYPRECTLCPEKANALNGSWCRRHKTLLEYKTVSPCKPDNQPSNNSKS